MKLTVKEQRLKLVNRILKTFDITETERANLVLEQLRLNHQITLEKEQNKEQEKINE